MRAITIEITRSEVEVLIQQSLQRGGFADAEDVFLSALRLLTPSMATGADLVAARKEIELESARRRKI